MNPVPRPPSESEIYELLQEVDYPCLPKCKSLAQNMLQQAMNIGWYDGDKLAVWVGLHGGCGNVVSMDIAVKPEYQKRWLTKGMLLETLAGIFEGGVEEIRVETPFPRMVKMSIKAGFVMPDDFDVSKHLHTGWFALKMTKEDFERRYKRG